MNTQTVDTPSVDGDMSRRLAEMELAAEVDRPRAYSLARQARQRGLSHPLIHHLVAVELKEAGKFEAAIIELGVGLQSDPNNSELMITTGFCLIELGRRQEAARVFEVAIRLDPTSAAANYGYGWAAERLGALSSAQSAFERTIAIDPDHADALAGLSGLAARRRDWKTARDLAERALARSDKQTDARMNLARVDLGEDQFDAAETRLRAILRLPGLNPEARSAAYLMLGDALDGARRYREAWDAYLEGKSRMRDRHRDTYAAAGVASASVVAERLLAEFESTPKAAWRSPTRTGLTGSARGHAFLVGFPRSGTTLLEQVLASHPQVVALGERPVMLDAEVEFLTRPGGVVRLSQVMAGLLEPYRESYWRNVKQFGIDVEDRVFVDKHPLGTIRLPLIHKVFPGARIIFAMRDPRDVVISCIRRSFNMNASTYTFTSLESAVEYYDTVMRCGERYLASLDLSVHRLRYEDLVADFEPVARGVCDFLQVDWHDGLRDFAAGAGDRLIATPSSTQVGRGLYEDGAGQWRRYAFALEPVMHRLAPWIEKFGYPTV